MRRGQCISLVLALLAAHEAQRLFLDLSDALGCGLARFACDFLAATGFADAFTVLALATGAFD
jgi:hypothetical protein